MSAISQHYQSLRDMVIKDIESQGATVFNGLLSDDSLTRIPESIFVQYFLPRFLGQINDTHWVIDWISIAGNPTSEVLVHADSDRDQILYKVPSLFNTNSILLARSRGSFKDVFNHYENIANNLPQKAQTFLLQALSEKESSILESHDVSDSINTWKSILERYGYTFADTNSQEASSSTGEDLFEY
jgi:hypothetical protein